MLAHSPGLPVYQPVYPPAGHTTILSIVDCFSKMALFIPLPKLPATKETVQLLLWHVFHLQGIPWNIVSYSAPQFIQFLVRFLSGPGVIISLSSGFHPQTNCQTE